MGLRLLVLHPLLSVANPSVPRQPLPRLPLRLGDLYLRHLVGDLHAVALGVVVAANLFARQISRRGGELFCRHLKERVAIGGRAVLYSKGEISAPQIPLAT